MNRVVVRICIELLLITSSLNANSIRLTPGERQIVHTNGSTHTISRLYVIPKYQLSGDKSKPVIVESDSERITHKGTDVNDVKADAVKMHRVFYKRIRNSENNPTDLDQHVQTNSGANRNPGRVHKTSYIIKWNSGRRLGNSSNDTDMKTIEKPRTKSETSRIYTFSFGDRKNTTLVDDAGNINESKSSHEVITKNVIITERTANKSELSEEVKETSTNAYKIAKIEVANDDFVKVVPLYDRNDNQDRGSDKTLKNYIDFNVNDLRISSEPYIKQEPDSNAEMATQIAETRVQTTSIVIDNIDQQKVGYIPKQQNIHNNINISISEDKYRGQRQNNVEDETSDPIIVIKELVERIKELKPIRYEDLHDEIIKHNSIEVETTRNYNSDVGKLMEGGKIKNRSHIIALISQICEAANQNIKDFWKILARYLGLTESDESVKRDDVDLLKMEKLYQILTIFTQLKMTSDLGYPIDHIIDNIVEFFPPNVSRNDNTVGDAKKQKCQHCVKNVDDKILNLFQKSGNTTHKQLEELPNLLSSEQVDKTIETESGDKHKSDMSSILINDNISSGIAVEGSLTDANGQTSNVDYFGDVSSDTEYSNENAFFKNDLVTESLTRRNHSVTNHYHTLVIPSSYISDSTVPPSGGLEKSLDTENIKSSKINNLKERSDLNEESHATISFDSKENVSELPLSEETNVSEVLSEPKKTFIFSNDEVWIPVNIINSYSNNDPKEDHFKDITATENDESIELSQAKRKEFTIRAENKENRVVNTIPLSAISLVSEDDTNELLTKRKPNPSYDNLKLITHSSNDLTPAQLQEILFETNTVSHNNQFSESFVDNTRSKDDSVISELKELSISSENTFLDDPPWMTPGKSKKHSKNVFNVDILSKSESTDIDSKSTEVFSGEHITDFEENHTDKAVKISHNKYQNSNDFYPHIIKTLGLPENRTISDSTPETVENSKRVILKIVKQPFVLILTEPNRDLKEDISNSREVELNTSEDTLPRNVESSEIEVTSPTSLSYDAVMNITSGVNTLSYPEEYPDSDSLRIPMMGEISPDHDFIQDISEDSSLSRTEGSSEIEMETPTNFIYYDPVKEPPSVVETSTYPEDNPHEVYLQSVIIGTLKPDKHVVKGINNNPETEVDISEDRSLPRTEESSEVEVATQTKIPGDPIKEPVSLIVTLNYPQSAITGEPWPDHELNDVSDIQEADINFSEDTSLPKTEESSAFEVKTPINIKYGYIKEISSEVDMLTYQEKNPHKDHLRFPIIGEPETYYDSREDISDNGEDEINISGDFSLSKTDESSEIEVTTPEYISYVPIRKFDKNEDQYKVQPEGPISKEPKPTHEKSDITKSIENIPSQIKSRIDSDYLEEHQTLIPTINLQLSAEEIPDSKIAFEKEIALPSLLKTPSSQMASDLHPQLYVPNKLPGSIGQVTEEINIPERVMLSDKGSLIPTMWRPKTAHFQTYLAELYPWLPTDKKPASPTSLHPEAYKKYDVALNTPNDLDPTKIKGKDLSDLAKLLSYDERDPQYNAHSIDSDPNDWYSNFISHDLQNPNRYAPILTEKVPVVSDNSKRPISISYEGHPMLDTIKDIEVLTPEYYLSRYNGLADPNHVNKGIEGQSLDDPSVNMLLARYEMLANPFVKRPSTTTVDLVQELKQLNDQKIKFDISKIQFQIVMKNRVKMLFVRIFLEVVPYLRERQVSDDVILAVVSECEHLLLPDLKDGFTSKCEMESYERSVEKVEVLIDSLMGR